MKICTSAYNMHLYVIVILSCIGLTGSCLRNSNSVSPYLELNDPTMQLGNQLEELEFHNQGIVSSKDFYQYMVIPSSYLEAENVTVVRNSWALKVEFKYLFQINFTQGAFQTPPLGMRSAVPLGGITTGNTELRADGSFHEWTITNQSPAGAAKVHVLKDLLFGIRTATKTKSQAYILQTHPTGVIDDLDGVEGLKYEGAYPVSKLTVQDSRLPVKTELYAYSTYSAGDRNKSAVPAIAFSLVVKNPSDEMVNISLMMNLPAGILHQQQRTQYNAKPCSASLQLDKNMQQCIDTCLAIERDCVGWNYDPSCTKPCQISTSMDEHIPLNSFKEDATSGLKGFWNILPHQQCLTYTTPGKEGPSGNISTCVQLNKDTTFSYTTSSSARMSDIWSSFKEAGHFNNDVIKDEPSVHGAVATQYSLMPGENKTVTFLLAWNYPYRDFEGVIYGNYYPHIYPNTESVVSHMNENILEIVQNISTLHQSFYQSSLPEFLADVYINSLGHIRSALWFADGRWRQWEAYDCTNLDSVHNDGERHIPYIMMFPDSTRNKMQAWAASQRPNGMIEEQLRCGCTVLDKGSKIDAPCGRYMSDVTSMFNVYLLELYQWGDDKDTLKSLWPTARRGILWHINETAEYGIPRHMVNTYDMIAQDAFDFCSYNSAFHILALKATSELAKAVGDDNLLPLINTALQKAYTAIDTLQWNETNGYYNSYTQLAGQASPPGKPGALMTDTFYAQVLAYTLGLGELLPNRSRLLSHMKQELLRNDSPYGMLVQTGKYDYPGPPRDGNAIWQMGNPNWATINIHLKQNVTHALEVAKKTLNHWREVENDLWNIPGVEGGIGYGAEGRPWDTSHYGYFMSSWHILFALSGQKMVAHELTFDPADSKAATWSYPVLLPGLLGEISQQADQTQCSSYCLVIHVGETELMKLAVYGHEYQTSYPLSLKAGDEKCWSSCSSHKLLWSWITNIQNYLWSPRKL